MPKKVEKKAEDKPATPVASDEEEFEEEEEDEDVAELEKQMEALKMKKAMAVMKKGLSPKMRNVQFIYSSLEQIKKANMMNLMEWMDKAVEQIDDEWLMTNPLPWIYKPYTKARDDAAAAVDMTPLKKKK